MFLITDYCSIINELITLCVQEEGDNQSFDVIITKVEPNEDEGTLDLIVTFRVCPLH